MRKLLTILVGLLMVVPTVAAAQPDAGVRRGR
jgi:hypothetical protein